MQDPKTNNPVIELGSLMEKYFANTKWIVPFVGAYLVLSYLVANKIPIPFDSNSTLLLLPVIAIAGVLVVFMGIVLIFLPVVTVRWFKLDLSSLYHPFRYEPGHMPLWRYFVFHVLVAAVWTGNYYLDWVLNIDLLSAPQEWALIFAVSLFGFLLIQHQENDYCETVKWYLLIAALNVILFIWFIFFMAILGPRLSGLYPGNDSFIFLGISFFLIPFHAIQIIPLETAKPDSQPEAQLALGLSAIALLLLLIPQVAVLVGGASLQIFGLGGDKKIKIEFYQDDKLQLPDVLKQKIDAKKPIYLAFSTPSQWYIRDTPDSTVTKIELKNVEKAIFLSNKEAIEFVQLFNEH
ncbi:MAG: hypothetical protein QM709_11880 [Spongiibacteraceae bacterium]